VKVPVGASASYGRKFILRYDPIRDCWFLVNEETGDLAVSDRGTTAFSVERAIKFLSALRE
jgi:hypothetical protein